MFPWSQAFILSFKVLFLSFLCNNFIWKLKKFTTHEYADWLFQTKNKNFAFSAEMLPNEFSALGSAQVNSKVILEINAENLHVQPKNLIVYLCSVQKLARPPQLLDHLN